MVLGPNLEPLFEMIQDRVLPIPAGELAGGPTVLFLGRRLREEGETIKLLVGENCIDNMLEEHGVHSTSPVVSLGSTTTAIADGVS